MARCPFARWRPLPENATAPRITPKQFILHTAVDQPGPTDLHKFFARSDVSVESHFWVWNDGTIDQFIDTERRADANRNANSTAISVETEDDGKPTSTPWNASQLDALIRLSRWVKETHGIPLRRCTSPTGAGVGYHAMWGAPSPWTPSSGKTCPGTARIAQIDAVISGSGIDANRRPELRLLKLTTPFTKGSDVEALQVALAAAGCPVEGGADGVFGHATDKALREFQRTRSLEVDGVFGPTTREALFNNPDQWVIGEIRTKWLELGGMTGVLGRPLTHELPCPDGSGRYNHFQGGSIYWTPDTKAHVVRGMIRTTWERLGWEKSFLGYPITDEQEVGGFPENGFQNGVIRWDHAGSAIINGKIKL